MKRKTHVSKENKDTVARFKKLIKDYKVIAAVDVENLPSKQLNQIRAQLRDQALLLMTKRRLLNIAIDESGKEGIQQLKEHLLGMSALLFSNENPFKLYSILKKSKSSAPIKAGQKAPNDIIVPAGPTSFAPGPIIGELGAIGIKVGTDGGKVTIKEDSIIAKEGDEISSTQAAMLARLEIYPMEIGLNLIAAFENGAILTKKDLNIDEDAFQADLNTAASDAFALTISLALPMKENIAQLLGKAHLDAYALADSQSIITSDNVKEVLAKADSQANALKSTIDS